ncbi:MULTISPECIES: HD domain-containing protein [Rhizobium/Agrobacterium group]|uniref:HD domain-containing protein n=1 Tax=Rhizobium/Agrobacterium group TaxID=227290 RepID=UPI0007141FE6|nr:HD domain-containing protein [Rhizobium sp. Root483D2]KQY21725.1 GTP pyrophosphokinase [Rhizobium sp. Root483D2]
MNLETAIKLATDAHASQVDEAGEPYILHPLRVMLAMKTNDQRIVAVLHDMVGDSHWTCNDLSSQHGFRAEIVEAVAALTRFRGEYYFDFIRRLAPNPIARAVKIADLRDKLNHSREILGDAQLRFRREKYRCALDMLLDI